MILTYRYRVKDASAAHHLERHARAVNFVWNYCCDVQRQAMKWQRRWPTWVDLVKLCTGAGAELGIHSDTVHETCRQFAFSRNVARRCPRFRASDGPRRALGWVPMIPRAFFVQGASIRYLKRRYPLWLSRPVEGRMLVASFNADARGRWYFNITSEVETLQSDAKGEIGIDLGLKTLATCSDGTTIPALQHYRQREAALGKAQRARNKGRARAIHAKIANSRRHHLHVESTRLVRANRRIVIGNSSPLALIKTIRAKSVLDAGWSAFRTMLAYKAIRHGCEYIETSENFTTQACSECGALGGPRGIAGLRMRAWDCQHCGASHDRDVNAARMILKFGLERQALAGGIPAT